MRATRGSWEHAPFVDGTPIPYQRTFDEPAFERLREGLIPGEMEDKWFIYFEDPHLFLHRSWTGKAYYRLTVENERSGARVTEAMLDSHVSYRDADDHTALLGWVVGRLLLGEDVPFPAFKTGEP